MSRHHAAADGSTCPAIEVHGVSRQYGSVLALDRIDLVVERGEFVVVVGPSGAGKSTLLNLLAALDRPDTGTIAIAGHELGRHEHHLNRLRRNDVGLVFQLHNLIPRLSAQENVEVAMLGTHHRRRERAVRAGELLERLDLAQRADERPPNLSGGERQRVAIARALANDPQVILADEPTGSLDDAAAATALDLLDDRRAAGATILAVSHDSRLNVRADRIVEIPSSPSEGRDLRP